MSRSRTEQLSTVNDLAAERALQGAQVDHDDASAISARKMARFLRASATTHAVQLWASARPI
jgi:hypothetical protein